MGRVARQEGSEKAGRGPQRHDGERGQGAREQTQLRCVQQSTSWEEEGPRAGETASRRKRGTIKDSRGKTNRRKGNKNKTERCHISFGI